MKLIHIPIILISVCLNAIAQILLKKGASSLNFDRGLYLLVECLKNFYLWSGFLCYGLSILIWIYVLSKMNVSLAYPFLSFGFVVSIFLANIFFGEPITFYKIFGITLICLGLVVLSLSRG